MLDFRCIYRLLQFFPPNNLASVKSDHNMHIGIEAFSAGNYIEALEAFQRCRQRHPFSWVVYYWLGETACRLHTPNIALPYAWRSVELNDRSVLGYRQLGYLHNLLQDYPSSIHYYQMAIARKPSCSISHAGLAYSFMSVGELTKAIKHMTLGLKEFPYNLELWHCLALCYELTGDWHTAHLVNGWIQARLPGFEGVPRHTISIPLPEHLLHLVPLDEELTMYYYPKESNCVVAHHD